ncbi:hypothetical protein Gasu2_38270 [Galdieria sulphuraria]|nr:hypothetical protein Gasu2_38270 [Galdieria sulphuraria]
MVAFLEISNRFCRTTSFHLRKEFVQVRRFRGVSGINKSPVQRSNLTICALPSIAMRLLNSRIKFLE